MNTSCDIYPSQQREQQYVYEQQMPSTSYAGGYKNPAVSYTYRSQAPGYFPPNYDMRVQYPQGQQQMTPMPSNGALLRPESATMNYPSRSQIDRKMMNTHEWMRNHRFMNVAQEHCRSGTAINCLHSFQSPSVISRFTHMSAATDVSMSSVQSLLSDVRRLEELRTGNSAVSSSSSSCVENINPNRNIEYEQTATACLDNICNIVQESIVNQDKTSLRSAVDSLFIITKNSDFNVASECSLEALMRKLVDLIARLDPGRLESEMCAIMERTLSAISRMLAFDKVKKLMDKWDVKSLLTTFVPWIIPSEKFCLFALTTIHSLIEMTDPRRCFNVNLIREIMIKSEVLQIMLIMRLVEVMSLMEQKGNNYFINSPKRKQYVFVLIRHVFYNDENLKLLFTSRNGMELLLHLLVRERDESTIYRIIHVLYALVSTSNKTFGLQFSNFKGLELLGRVAEKLYQSYRVVEYALLALRAVSDIEEIRASDNAITINHTLVVMERYRCGVFEFDRNSMGACDVARFKSFSYILSIGVEFLGNIAASGRGMKNANKDFIVEGGIIIPHMVSLLNFYKRARLKWKEVKEVETLIAEIIWALKIFTGVCLSKERTVKASTDLLKAPNAPEILLQELAETPNLSCRLDILNILIRVIESDPLNHPQRLRSIIFNGNNVTASFASILLDVIATTVNIKEASLKPIAKQIMMKAYALLLLLANSNLNCGNEIRGTWYAFTIMNSSWNYQMADFLWSVVEDSDLAKYVLEFITFVAAEESFRDCFSKDFNLIGAIRHLAEQVNENSAAAQSLLFSLTCETAIPFGSVTLL
uniref:Beta-catenin-like protein 1 n=1 Tax=Syphacia muris TaxID=451379 RepID=A0A0N5ADA1_9BILA